MGRIDEALSRVRAGGADGNLPVRPAQSAFAAPWTFDDRMPAQPSRELAEESSAHTPTLLGDAEPMQSAAFNPAWVDRLVISATASPALVEQFRGLAAALHRLPTGSELKVIMVTSAEAGEGKTHVATNLALTLSESYRRRVLLVEADLRRPSIAKISQISNLPGLSEALKAKTARQLSLIQLTRTLTLLPAGCPDPDPMSGLTSPRMRQIIDEAAARFDWVILDAPPLGPIADASLLAGIVDAVLLAVRAQVTPCAAVQAAIENVGRDKILGVVLNAVDESQTAARSHYYGQLTVSSD